MSNVCHQNWNPREWIRDNLQFFLPSHCRLSATNLISQPGRNVCRVQRLSNGMGIVSRTRLRIKGMLLSNSIPLKYWIPPLVVPKREDPVLNWYFGLMLWVISGLFDGRLLGILGTRRRFPAARQAKLPAKIRFIPPIHLACILMYIVHAFSVICPFPRISCLLAPFLFAWVHSTLQCVCVSAFPLVHLLLFRLVSRFSACFLALILCDILWAGSCLRFFHLAFIVYILLSMYMHTYMYVCACIHHMTQHHATTQHDTRDMTHVTWHYMTLHDVTWHYITWHYMTLHDITRCYMISVQNPLSFHCWLRWIPRIMGLW